MCNWEEYAFSCGHSTFRLQSRCHRARNDPYHECFFVKVLRDVWEQGVPCDNCIREQQILQQQILQQQLQQQQLQQRQLQQQQLQRQQLQRQQAHEPQAIGGEGYDAFGPSDAAAQDSGNAVAQSSGRQQHQSRRHHPH